jgi:uncharacterized protein (TIGR03437 family)
MMLFSLRLVALFLVTCAAVWAQDPFSNVTIRTYAGSDSILDGGQATLAYLHVPRDVAVDAAGNVYIADEENELVRKVSPDGVITTVAGNRQGLASGPLATELPFAPSCVAVAPNGNVYFCSFRQVWEILPNGEARRVVGTGGSGGTGDGGPAVDATFGILEDIAFGADGTLYVTDRLEDVIRRVGADGVITRFAGTGEPGFSGDGGPAAAAQLDAPSTMAFDAAGNLLVLDGGNNRIRQIAPNGTISTFAGNGATSASGDGGGALEAGLGFVRALAVAEDGSVYFADAAQVRRVDPQGIVQRVGGALGSSPGSGGPVLDASFALIEAMAFGPDGTLYIVELGPHTVRAVGVDGIIQPFAGRWHLQGDGGPATEAQLFGPTGMALGADASLYIADTANLAIRRVTADGVISTVAGGNVTGPEGGDRPALEAKLRDPQTVAVHPLTGEVYFGDSGSGLVRRITQDGMVITVAGGGGRQTSGDGGPATAAGLGFPLQIAFDPAGNLYIADLTQNRVRKVDPNGMISTFAGSGVFGSGGDGGLATEADLASPRGVAVNAGGDVFISENVGIRRVAADGVISLFSQSSQRLAELSFRQNGELMGVNPNTRQLFGISTSGERRQLVRFGLGFSGDEGPAGQAKTYELGAARESPDGRVFVTDKGNDRVRVLAVTPTLPEGAIRQGASFFQGVMAPGTIISVFGDNLANSVASAASIPLPTELIGTRAQYKDSADVVHDMPLFFVSEGQINLMIPEEAALGEGILTVSAAGGSDATALALTSAAPGLFAANATGRGVAAAFAVRVAADGTQTTEPVFELNEQDEIVARTIAMGTEDEQVFLVLFGTGIRGGGGVDFTSATLEGLDVPVLYAGPQGSFVGLDQVNVGPIPRNFVGYGEVEVQVATAGRASNRVTVVVE